jgi:ABC-type glycerol-3-phosphate transport system substrate-binding protein
MAKRKQSVLLLYRDPLQSRRKSMTRKLLAVFLCTLFLVLGASVFAGGKQEPAAAKEYPLGTIPTEPVTINMWQISGSLPDWTNAIFALYQKDHPNVSLNMTIQSDEFIDTNTITTLATHPKDIDINFFWSGTRIQRLAKDRSILNLDSWYQHYNWDNVFHQGARSTNVIEGFGHVCFNFTWYSFQPFYNKDLFKKAGVVPPTKNLDEFWTMCEKIKQSGTEVMSMGGKDAWPLHLLWSQMIGRFLNTKDANKLNMYSLQATRTKQDAEIFRSKGAVQAWQFMADMNKKGYFSPGVNSLDWLDSIERFASKKASMLMGFVPFTFADAKGQDPNFPVDYFFMPDTAASDGGIVFVYNDVFVVPIEVAGIKKPILADFLNRTLVDKAFIELLITKGNSNPPTKNITPEEVVKISGNPELGRFFKEMQGKPTLQNTDTTLSLELIKEYYNDLMEVTQGTMTAEQAAQRMYELALDEVD